MIVVPQPMPDEIARSILGRMMRWNGLGRCNGAESIKVLREVTGIAASEAGGTVALIAKLLNRDPRDFVEQHTLLPWWLIVRTSNWLDDDGCLRDSSLAQTIQPQRPYVSLCPECVYEDLQFHGFSYWRRSHQLDGVYECLKHDVGLRHYGSVDPAMTYPSEALEYAPLMVSGPLSAAERRFQRLITYLGENRVSINKNIVLKRFKELLKERGEDTCGRDHLVSIQARIDDLFSDEWMRQTVPGFRRDRAVAVSRGLRNIFRQAHLSGATHAIAFAIAAMNREDDVFDLFAAPPSDIEIRACKPRRTMPGSEALSRAYIKHKGRYANFMPGRFSDPDHCRALLAELGLPDLDRQLLEAARLFYTVGLSTSETLQKTGVDSIRFEALLRTAGTNLRRACEQMENAAPREAERAKTTSRAGARTSGAGA